MNANLKLDDLLEAFLLKKDLDIMYMYCAGCCDSNVKHITITLVGNILWLNTFCSKLCISKEISNMYNDSAIYLIINCNSFDDIYNKEQEILGSIEKLKKADLLT